MVDRSGERDIRAWWRSLPFVLLLGAVVLFVVLLIVLWGPEYTGGGRASDADFLIGFLGFLPVLGLAVATTVLAGFALQRREPGRGRLQVVLAFAICVMVVGPIVLIAAPIPLSAAVPPPVGRNLVGTWTHGDATIRLKADGTFSMRNVPTYTLFTTDQDWQHWDGSTRSGTGTWHTEFDAVRLETDEAGENIGAQRLLEFDLQLGSAEPACYQFARKGSAFLPPSPAHCALAG